MTRTSSNPFLLLFGMVLFVGLSALVLLNLAQTTTTVSIMHQASAVTIDWLQPDQVTVPRGLTISEHAAKHHGDTERIYQMLLEGKCVEVQKFCGGSESEFAYFCVDPVTGIVGAILQIGDTIETGYYERAGTNYWIKRIPKEKWTVCNDEYIQ